MKKKKAGLNMSEEWRKFELHNKILGGKCLREYSEELCKNGRTV
jgi:hypothetical protein